MSDLLRLACEERGHVPVDIDPTGGDPWMGGPVLITECDRCGRQLEHSEAAKAFNAANPYRPAESAPIPTPAPKRKKWWQR